MFCLYCKDEFLWCKGTGSDEYRNSRYYSKNTSYLEGEPGRIDPAGMKKKKFYFKIKRLLYLFINIHANCEETVRRV